MRPGVGARLGRTAPGLSPGTDPVCLLITTVAVVVGLVAAGLASGPASPAAAGHTRRTPAPQRATLIPPARGQSGQSALRLLASAAAAGGSDPYHGMEMLAWWGPRATTAAVADVWHRPGREPALRAVAPSLEWPSGAPSLGPPVSRSAVAAVPGLSPQLVSLLAANYVLAVGGAATVAGRPALVVTVRRAGGGLAGRFWLDKATKLPLRRETYGASGGLLSEEAFLSLSLGPDGQAASPVPAARPWQDKLGARQLASLRARGWPVRSPLPGNLALLDAREVHGRDGPVVHLAYSDGLATVSVFVERGSLPPGLAGWSRTAMAGHPVYADDADDGSVAWSAGGFVFTVIAQAPARMLSAVVAALPHGPAARPGLLGRMRLGADRLIAWLGFAR